MLSGVQPCFQLLRIGSSGGDSARDLYTFRPALNQCVFRLGRAAELCDVTLDSTSVSRIHAELQAERETGSRDTAPQDEGWRVHIKDRSSHGEGITLRGFTRVLGNLGKNCPSLQMYRKVNLIIETLYTTLQLDHGSKLG